MTSKKVNITWPDASLLILVSAALLYTSGWSYAYHYFARYHMGLLDIAISKEYFFVYAFWVIRSQWVMIIIGFCLFFCGFILIEKYLKPLVGQTFKDLQAHLPVTSIKIFMLLSFLIFHLCVFIFFYYTGKRAAVSDYHYQTISDYPSYPLVKIWIKPDSKIKNHQFFVEELNSGCYRLLLKNNGKLYVFHSSSYIGKKATLVVSESKVELLQVLPYYVSCPDTNE